MTTNLTPLFDGGSCQTCDDLGSIPIADDHGQLAFIVCPECGGSAPVEDDGAPTIPEEEADDVRF